MLTPWCFPNPFRDQGAHQGKVRGKELCDLLIVFGNDVIIFSDKHVQFRKHNTIELSWARWYRDAVLESAKQLEGAKRWIETHPNRVFETGDCSSEIFIPQNATEVKVHLILTCRGAAKACQTLFGGGTGSLISRSVRLADPELSPFQVGSFTEKGNVIHVFDSEVMDVIFKHLDTLPDFIRYLHQREDLAKSNTAFMTVGEEELLAVYLSDLNADGLHGFKSLQKYTSVLTQEGLLASYTSSHAYASKKDADKDSYVWDDLIEHLFGSLVTTDGAPMPFTLRTALYWMAREGRVRRRVLGRSILAVIRSAKQGRFVRVFKPTNTGDVLWVFMALRKPPNITFNDYVSVRQEMLWSYVLAARHLFRTSTNVVGIGLNAWGDAPTSEDFLCLSEKEWTEELADQGRQAFEKEGFLSNVETFRAHESEYPNPSSLNAKKTVVRARHANVGRNSQCPCGSGKKYKKCCGPIAKFD